MTWRVPLFATDIRAEDRAAVDAVLASGWLTMGDRVREFEERFAAYIGVRHAIAVASCTAGLHLVHLALNIGRDHDVVCPSLTFVAGANTIEAVGARAVFADIVDPVRPVLSAATIEAALTPQTSAVQVLHYAGWPMPIAEIIALAAERGIAVIEDCAHAPGAEIDGRRVGSFGTAGVFSFFSNKNLSVGEGGMVTTDDAALARRIRLLRSHGMTTLTLDRHRGHAFSYDVTEFGLNYRLDEMRAALGLVQLDRLPAANARRTQIYAHYQARLIRAPRLTLPFLNSAGTSVHHIMPVLLAPGIDREAVMQKMKDAGIQTSIHYPPVHLFQFYRTHRAAPPGRLANTEDAGRRLLTLPLYPAMTSADVDLVCDTLQSSLRSLAA
jgi:dTDP-4-amino-4,6-dideoxygalactose transaminase